VYDAVIQYKTDQDNGLIDGLTCAGIRLFAEVDTELLLKNPFVELLACLMYDREFTIPEMQSSFVKNGCVQQDNDDFVNAVFKTMPRMCFPTTELLLPLTDKHPGCYFHTHGEAKSLPQDESQEEEEDSEEENWDSASVGHSKAFVTK
jgi:hypothetical protein